MTWTLQALEKNEFRGGTWAAALMTEAISPAAELPLLSS